MADIENVKKIADPVERAKAVGKALAALPDVAAELRAMRQEDVLRLREQGWSFGKIGEALGIHRNRVQQIADGKTSGGKTKKSGEDVTQEE